jgi:hypothetical protein
MKYLLCYWRIGENQISNIYFLFLFLYANNGINNEIVMVSSETAIIFLTWIDLYVFLIFRNSPFNNQYSSLPSPVFVYLDSSEE